MEEIVYYLGQIFNFILVFFIIIILLFLVFKISLKKTTPKNDKIKIYGIFMGLKDNEILSMGILTIKYMFTIWCVIGTNKDNYIYLGIILLLGIFYNILNKRILNILFDSINSGVIYAAFMCKNVFFNYLNEVTFEWYVLILGVFLSIFVILYSSYFFVKDLDYILKKNKHVSAKINIKNK